MDLENTSAQVGDWPEGRDTEHRDSPPGCDLAGIAVLPGLGIAVGVAGGSCMDACMPQRCVQHRCLQGVRPCHHITEHLGETLSEIGLKAGSCTSL